VNDKLLAGQVNSVTNPCVSCFVSVQSSHRNKCYNYWWWYRN